MKANQPLKLLKLQAIRNSYRRVKNNNYWTMMIRSIIHMKPKIRMMWLIGNQVYHQITHLRNSLKPKK